MPSYRGHILGGVAAFAATSFIAPSLTPQLLSPLSSLGALSICLMGALFPDIDTRSVGRRYFYYALTVGALLALFQQTYSLLLFLATLGMFPLLTPHRGMTHNPLFLIISPVVLLRIAYPDAPWLSAVKLHHYLYFVSGAISHIILDFAPYKLVKKKLTKARRQKKKR